MPVSRCSSARPLPAQRSICSSVLNTGRASIALRLSINGQHRDVPMALSPATITALALTAETKGMRMTEFAARLLTDAIEREES